MTQAPHLENGIAAEVRDLASRLRALHILDEVGSDNPLGREAADMLERLASRPSADHEAVRQRAVEERIREHERDRLYELAQANPTEWVSGFLARNGGILPSGRVDRAALRKPANEEGGGEDGYLVRIGFREDGGLRISSPDVPGLVLSHRNVDGVLQDMITVLRDHRASPPPSDQSGGTA